MTGRDVIVIGSGFGGSVAALRLAEKGYRVTVLEAGRRFADSDFATSPWQLPRIVWAPRWGLRGVVRLRLRRNLLVLSGVGVGGGSLAYAGVHYRPPGTVFQADGWDRSLDWTAALAPFYATAERMLGSTDAVFSSSGDGGDRVLRQVGHDLGKEADVRPVSVGVHFGAPGVSVPDPFFGGLGPDRTGCTGCGRCVLGCPFGAKNTLVKNYLHLAEGIGARIRPLTTVTGLRPREGGGWRVQAEHTGAAPTRQRELLDADQVVLAAGAWGTAELLHRARLCGALPDLSPALGTRTCTNREVLLAATGAFDVGPGVAISSALRADDGTTVQLARLGGGTHPLSAALRPLSSPRSRAAPTRPHGRCFGRRTAFFLAMEGRDSTLTSHHDRRRLTFVPDAGPEEPVRLAAAEEVARRYAAHIDGTAYGLWINHLLKVPTTAHLMGGCPLGNDPRTAVADLRHRVHGHPTLHIADASVITANLGVNPALTVTAMAERAFALWETA